MSNNLIENNSDTMNNLTDNKRKRPSLSIISLYIVIIPILVVYLVAKYSLVFLLVVIRRTLPFLLLIALGLLVAYLSPLISVGQVLGFGFGLMIGALIIKWLYDLPHFY